VDDLTALPGGLGEPGFLQRTQVEGCGGGGLAQAFGNLSGRQPAGPGGNQQSQDGEAGFLGQSSEDL